MTFALQGLIDACSWVRGKSAECQRKSNMRRVVRLRSHLPLLLCFWKCASMGYVNVTVTTKARLAWRWKPPTGHTYRIRARTSNLDLNLMASVKDQRVREIFVIAWLFYSFFIYLFSSKPCQISWPINIFHFFLRAVSSHRRNNDSPDYYARQMLLLSSSRIHEMMCLKKRKTETVRYWRLASNYICTFLFVVFSIIFDPWLDSPACGAQGQDLILHPDTNHQYCCHGTMPPGCMFIQSLVFWLESKTRFWLSPPPKSCIPQKEVS